MSTAHQRSVDLWNVMRVAVGGPLVTEIQVLQMVIRWELQLDEDSEASLDSSKQSQMGSLSAKQLGSQ